VTASLVGGLSGIVFDAYGTLFDVAALEVACIAVTEDPVRLSALWRAKQLEYSVLRTTMDRYADWGQITSDALDYAATALGVDLEPAQRRDLMRAWLRLPPFPDAPPALARFAAAELRMAILSNGSLAMLQPLLEHSDLRRHFDEVLSSEHVQAFKPDAALYGLAQDRLQARPYELLFVSSNGFDIAGAKAFGFTVCRVNRNGLPMDSLGLDPDFTVETLTELADRLLLASPS
jgi:2-haloacid dehalogenase